MKRTYFYLFGLVMTLTSCVNGIAPSKNKITKKYSVEAFDNIASQGTVNIVFKQSNATTVEAYGPDNIISSLIVTSEDSTLHISMKKGVKFRSLKNNNVTITITAPKLSSISQQGTGNITLKDSVKVDDIKITSNGTGNFKADELTADNMSVRSDGIGNVILKGKAEKASYHIKGIGNLNAKDMIVSDVVVEQKGIGNVSCYASGKITVSTNGIGNVDYFGNPPTTDINKSGIGNVKRR